jgi:hypothetical protein
LESTTVAFIRRTNMVRSILFAALIVVGSYGVTRAADFVLDAAAIEEAAGAKGTLNKAEGVFKVTYPRTDVPVIVDGTKLPPFMGLTSWAAFMGGMENEAMVMGDFVLLQDEVNPVMSVALDNGLDVTALHNHFFYDEPRVYFMHIGGEGDPTKLAGAVKAMQARIKEIRAAAPHPATGFGLGALPAKSSITPGPVEAVLGKGQANEGMFKVVIGRTTKMPCGCTVGKEMGVNTWAAFYGDDAHAMVDGDVAVFEGELQTVLKSLRHSGVEIVAIHSHMESETPKVLFLHYWSIGPAKDLAMAVKNAMDAGAKASAR